MSRASRGSPAENQPLLSGGAGARPFNELRSPVEAAGVGPSAPPFDLATDVTTSEGQTVHMAVGHTASGVVTLLDQEEPALQLRLWHNKFYTLPGTEFAPSVPPGIIVKVETTLEEHPFRAPPSSTAGSVGMAAMKLTGVGYAYYRAANTRLNPGYIMWLQDGSEQYVINRPGLYYFPGPTRRLSDPQRIAGQECIELGNTKIVTVPPASIGFCSYMSTVHILEPGCQYILTSPLIRYLGSEPLDSQDISKETVDVIRLQAGEFACVLDAHGHVVVLEKVGRYLLRAPERRLGTHKVNDARIEYANYQRVLLKAGQLVFYQDSGGNTQFYDQPGIYQLRAPALFHPKVWDLYENVISHGPVTLLRVQTGQLACIQSKDGDVHVLTEAKRYLLRAPEKLLNLYDVNEPRIEHGTYARVRLQAGRLIFFQDESGETQFYERPGTYELRRPAFFDARLYEVTEQVITFGSITRVNIRLGQISFKYDVNNNTVVLDQPGVHIIRRPELFGGQIYDINRDHIQMGAFDILNVQPGHVAITYDGRPADQRASIREKVTSGAMSPSAPYIDPDHPALIILPAGRHILNHELWNLKQVRSVQEKRLDLSTKVYSRNRVSFVLKAFILYRVMNPVKAFVEVENIDDELQREAEATILSIFGAHDSGEVAQGVENTTAASKGKQGETATAVAPPSYEEASFAEVVRNSFQHDFAEFAEKRGVTLSRMRVEHIDFDDKDMKVAIEKQAENTVRIEAERRNVVQQNQTRIAKAEGEARALKAESEGRAAAMTAEAQSEANKIRLLAGAQAEASSNPLATQIALIKAYAEGQAIIYAALSKNTQIIPSDIMLSTNALPAQVAQFLGSQPGSMFMLPDHSKATREAPAAPTASIPSAAAGKRPVAENN